MMTDDISRRWRLILILLTVAATGAATASTSCPEGMDLLGLRGDADGSSLVDMDDFAIVKANYGTGAGWRQGDFSGDDDVDLDDFAILKTWFGRRPGVPMAELNHDIDLDGQVDLDDLVLLKAHWGEGICGVPMGFPWSWDPIIISAGAAPVSASGCPRGVPVEIVVPGDANLDRVVDLDDFGILKRSGWITPGAVWPDDADFDRDGDVDLDDFAILKTHFGMRFEEAETICALWSGWDFNFDGWADLDDLVYLKDVDYGGFLCGEYVGSGGPGGVTPEPASAALLALGALAAIRRRR